MNFIKQNSGVIAVIALIIAIIGVYTPQGQSFLGAVTGETNYNTIGGTGIKVGSNCGDSFTSTAANGCKETTHLIATTCSLILTGVPQAATTTKAYDCAITGITSSDTVTLAQLSTTTINGANQLFNIAGSKASTTAGFLTVILENESGGSLDPNALGIGGTVSVFIGR